MICVNWVLKKGMKTVFNELDTVRLKKSNGQLGITEKNIGAIVDVLGDGEIFTVEFIDSDGNTIEASLFVTFTSDELELVEAYPI